MWALFSSQPMAVICFTSSSAISLQRLSLASASPDWISHIIISHIYISHILQRINGWYTLNIIESTRLLSPSEVSHTPSTANTCEKSFIYSILVSFPLHPFLEEKQSTWQTNSGPEGWLNHYAFQQIKPDTSGVCPWSSLIAVKEPGQSRWFWSTAHKHPTAAIENGQESHSWESLLSEPPGHSAGLRTIQKICWRFWPHQSQFSGSWTSKIQPSTTNNQ